MTTEQTAHLNRILEDATREITDKYIQGTIEHKTLLSKDYSIVEIMEFAMDEIKDLYTYMHTAREMIRDCLKVCMEDNGIPVCKNCGLGEK